MKQVGVCRAEADSTKGGWRAAALLLAVFFLSGMAGLIYQVAWQRLLSLHYGVGAISITLIVSIYMFGLGLGALAGGWLAERVRRRIFLYCVVEALTGVFGLCSVRFLAFIGHRTAGSSFMLSVVFMSLFLCLPTLLMGTTLPILVKIFNCLVRDFVRTVSLLYFVNTIGAAAGALAASYVLISLFGLDAAVYTAAMINLVLAAAILAVSRVTPPPQAVAAAQAQKHTATLGNLAYPVVFLTGFLAIGYEIVWFRVVEVLVKASAYAFSTVLFVYLAGIGLGSYMMGRCLHRKPQLINADSLFTLQLLVAVCVMVIFVGYCNLTWYTPLGKLSAASFLCEVHPPLVATPFPKILGRWFPMVDILIWPMVFVFVPTLLIGASFPLVSALALSRPGKDAGTVGTVYFVNVVGNVLGGAVTGFVLLEVLGTERTLLAFSIAGLLFGLLIGRFGKTELTAPKRLAFIAVMVIVNLAAFPKKGEIFETIHRFAIAEPTLYMEEGVDSVVVTGTDGAEVTNFINGLGHGRRPHPFFTYETIEALSFAPRVEKVLVIGFGAGTVTEAVLTCDETRDVTVVELSGTLMKNLEKIPLYKKMLGDGRVTVIIDDGRRFLLRSDEKFDVILADPLRATTAYSNNLYSRQFYELAAGHLNPGGVLMVGVYEHDDAINKVMRKTVASAFDHVRVYRFFCLGSNGPLERNERRRERLLERTPPQLQKSLRAEKMLDFAAAEIGDAAEPKLEDVYLGQRQFIEETTAGFPVNTDNKPMCEYYIGLKLKDKLGPRQ